GIKILLDCVPNHIGPRHPWVKAPPQPDWFHGTAEHHIAAHSPFDGLTDPHAVPQRWRDVVEGWFANVLPDLNQDNPQVAQYLLQNSLWWAEQTGLDGYRLDTVPYVGRRFWSAWHQELRRAYPRITTVGEVFHPDPSVTSFFAGGRAQYDGIDSGVTTIFDFPFFYALRDVILRGAPANRLAETFQRDWLYAKPQMLVPFLGSHDVKRFTGEPGSSKEKLKLAFSLLLSVRGIPQIYSGDEIGMPGGDDPDNRRDFPGGFPGDPRNAFAAEGRTADQQEIFAHVQALLRLRKAHPALARGTHWQIAWDTTSYVFVRETPEERLLVVFNNADQPRILRLNLEDTPLASSRALEPLFAARPAVVRGAWAELEAAPRSLAVYRVR
ncbi:MAG: alpha-amylase, partial [Acidobacteria bacterium]|nr:alpha-amylase [Acidobacteriota bacterium]